MSVDPNDPNPYSAPKNGPGGPVRPGGPAEPSGAVTAVGVVNYILGVLQLLCGGCIAFGGGMLAGFAGEISRQNAEMDPEGAEALETIMQVGGGLIVALGAAYLLLGLLLLVAGYGVTARRRWGRILTLVLGAVAGVLGVLGFFGGEWIGATTNIAYAVFVYIVLLNDRNAAEFV